jgi:peptide/nickel transport system substrate-binding protein
MKSANSAFLTGVTDYRNRMVPREMPGQLSFDDPGKFVGSGPFVMQKADVNVEVVLAKNPAYWRKDKFGGAVPYLDTFSLRWVADDASTMAAFLAKQVQYRNVNTPDERDTVKKRRPDATILKHPVGNRDQWRMNVKKKPFDDPRVRKAMLLTLDLADINNAYYGQNNWDYSAVLPSSFPGAFTSDEVKKIAGYNPETKQQAVADGKKMMEAAGYADGNGVSIGILAYPTVEPYKTHAINIQSQMKSLFPKMAVRVDVAPDSATFTRSQAEGSFDTTSFAIIPVFDAALDFQTQYATTGSRNYGKYSNPALDALIDKALAEFDDNARYQILKQGQQMVLDDGNPTLWLNQQFYYHAFDPSVHGVAEILTASTFGGSSSALPIQLADFIWLGKA